MKVIHFIGSIDKTGGGTTEYIRLLGNALKSSIELIVATGLSDSPITIDGVRIQFFDTKVLRWFSLLNEFRVFLKAESPDIVHINGIWSPENWGFQKIAQDLGVKVVLSPHGMLETWILAQNPWKKKIGLFIYQNKAICNAQHLHATAQMEKNSIRNLGYTNAITIIPNGIDLSEIKKKKERFGSKKMIFLSRIHPKKGIELLLEAWGNTDTKDWTLEIAGNGDENYILKLIESAQDIKNVSFVGAQYGEAKWDFLRSADVMVLPTYSENFGIVVAEALVVGIPVITTKGTPWQDLETYNCGWWIDLSVLNLKLKLEEIIDSTDDQIKTMGDNGRRLIKDKYDIKIVAKNLNELYQNLI
ncbi:glycosyltransferase [Flavobacterium cellulosilyticum]|uniref:Glycosyltransferase n=1 Tax=Flavobacterium cellulosilyticum TaxID=2541731 RepID=A0A4R5CC51_9FLAO|nr:glycosyltransferase [Flavobacterium cellulosilyticum]TDD94682.1 glycosyltransferase [Flavobacterium cellulosilyticum]